MINKHWNWFKYIVLILITFGYFLSVNSIIGMLLVYFKIYSPELKFTMNKNLWFVSTFFCCIILSFQIWKSALDEIIKNKLLGPSSLYIIGISIILIYSVLNNHDRIADLMLLIPQFSGLLFSLFIYFFYTLNAILSSKTNFVPSLNQIYLIKRNEIKIRISLRHVLKNDLICIEPGNILPINGKICTTSKQKFIFSYLNNKKRIYSFYNDEYLIKGLRNLNEFDIWVNVTNSPNDIKKIESKKIYPLQCASIKDGLSGIICYTFTSLILIGSFISFFVSYYKIEPNNLNAAIIKMSLILILITPSYYYYANSLFKWISIMKSSDKGFFNFSDESFKSEIKIDYLIINASDIISQSEINTYNIVENDEYLKYFLFLLRNNYFNFYKKIKNLINIENEELNENLINFKEKNIIKYDEILYEIKIVDDEYLKKITNEFNSLFKNNKLSFVLLKNNKIVLGINFDIIISNEYIESVNYLNQRKVKIVIFSEYDEIVTNAIRLYIDPFKMFPNSTLDDKTNFINNLKKTNKIVCIVDSNVKDVKALNEVANHTITSIESYEEFYNKQHNIDCFGLNLDMSSIRDTLFYFNNVNLFRCLSLLFSLFIGIINSIFVTLFTKYIFFVILFTVTVNILYLILVYTIVKQSSLIFKLVRKWKYRK